MYSTPKQCLGLAAVLVLLAACSKVTPPAWTRMTPPGGADRVVYLDTANVVVNAGVIYVTLQTRTGGDAPGVAGRPFGIAHAEANCRQHKIEPTALKEDQYGADGARLAMKLTSLSAEETEAVLAAACKGR